MDRRCYSRRSPTIGWLFEYFESRILCTFGLTTTASTYTVNTGANVAFSVARTKPSNLHVGDLLSLKFNSIDLVPAGSGSHYGSGLSNTAVITAKIDPSATPQWAVITCDDSANVDAPVILYYIAHRGENNLYMAMYSATEPTNGEMRYITYANHSLLTMVPASSDLTGNTGYIESSDIFGFADGTTASKYYGEYRAIDKPTYGLTGGGYGLFMNIGSREKSSGGPFYKDIDYQTTDAQVSQLYNYAYSLHSQTEDFRPGLKGPFALQAIAGTATPSAPDYSWIESSGLSAYISGFVTTSHRGSLSGTASGVASGKQVTVSIQNADAQYWTTPDAVTGAYSINGIIEGTYTETLFEGELEVGTVQVTVSAGSLTRQDITKTLYTPAASDTVFRIGTWDGTPTGFLNADKIQDMHPSDIRMTPWAADSTGITNYTVGVDSDSAWPMAIWQYQTTYGSSGPWADTVNRITFTLTAAQAVTPLTLRLGITALKSGRPIVSTNGGSYSSVPGVPASAGDRQVTKGNWRGFNYTYSYSLSGLHAGTNTVDIKLASGSSSAGNFLAPWTIYDAIDLVTTSSITNAPRVTSVKVSPENSTVGINQQQAFTAQAFDQNGAVIPANFNWLASAGTVDGTGLFLSPPTSGSVTLSATAGTVSGSTLVIVGTPNMSPTVAAAASAAPNPVTLATTNLSVLGADDGGEPLLTYSWSANGPGTVTFSTNNTNSAKNTTASFAFPDTYTLRATIKDAGGLTVTSETTVVFAPLPGDANFDGNVDLADFDIWYSHVGTNANGPATGDFNLDTNIDLADFDIWYSHVGAVRAVMSTASAYTTAEVASTTAIAPEGPSSVQSTVDVSPTSHSSTKCFALQPLTVGPNYGKSGPQGVVFRRTRRYVDAMGTFSLSTSPYSPPNRRTRHILDAPCPVLRQQFEMSSAQQ